MAPFNWINAIKNAIHATIQSLNVMIHDQRRITTDAWIQLLLPTFENQSPPKLSANNKPAMISKGETCKFTVAREGCTKTIQMYLLFEFASQSAIRCAMPLWIREIDDWFNETQNQNKRKRKKTNFLWKIPGKNTDNFDLAKCECFENQQPVDFPPKNDYLLECTELMKNFFIERNNTPIIIHERLTAYHVHQTHTTGPTNRCVHNVHATTWFSW